MCLFIYALATQCGHQTFQNVSECPVARGLPTPHTPADRLNPTLPAPKFLFDTRRSKTHTPEFYARAFACPKRKAVRPVPDAVCDECVKLRREEGVARLALASVSEEEGGEMEQKSGRLVLPKVRSLWGRSRSGSGSSVALVGGGGPSASSTASSLNTDTSTPRSI